MLTFSRKINIEFVINKHIRNHSFILLIRYSDERLIALLFFLLIQRLNISFILMTIYLLLLIIS